MVEESVVLQFVQRVQYCARWVHLTKLVPRPVSPYP
jgi:hypothetical protein